jgi:ABC-type transporter Mla subunit MlaD
VARDRNNIAAGFAVGVALAASLAGVFAWTAWQRRGLVPYVVHFSSEQGVYGLKEGSPILVGGMPLGELERIEPAMEDGHVHGYDVHIRVSRSVPLYAAAKVGRGPGSVSGDTQIEVWDTGEREARRSSDRGDDAPVAAGTEFRARDADAFKTYFGLSLGGRVRELMQSWAPAEPGTGLPARLETIGEDMSARFREMRAAAAALTDRVREDGTRWQEELKAARDAADSAIAKLGTAKDAPQTALVPQMRQAKADLDSLSSMSFDRADQADALATRAIDRVRHMRVAGGELADLLLGADGSVTDLQRFAADFAIAAQELSATEREAVTNPLGLLGAPDPSPRSLEARTEFARAYAECAVEWRHAMKSIELALQRDQAVLASQPALAELLRSRLDASTRRFEDASRRMADLLVGESPAP